MTVFWICGATGSDEFDGCVDSVETVSLQSPKFNIYWTQRRPLIEAES